MNPETTNQGMSAEDVLADKIKYLNYKYRKGEQEVSDDEYDSMVEQLHTINPENPLFDKGVIDETPTGDHKDKLPIPMYSLDKCKNLNEIVAWLKSKNIDDSESIILTPKYNGISILKSKNAEKVWTRGDGEFGMRCEQHFKAAHSDMLEFNGIDPFVFGEMIIQRDNWEAHFKGRLSPSGKPFKLNNATVAGLINQDKPSKLLEYVDFIPYGLANCDLANDSKYNQLSWLKSARTDVYNIGVQFFETTVGDLKNDPCFIDEMYNIWNIQFPCDGIVFDINNPDLRKKLGRESNMNPAYARALKLSKWSESYATTITDYDFQISKQGKLKGVVKIDPLIIDGTDVKQATFYNAKFLLDWKLFPGTEITIKKSGDIIPKITSVWGVIIPQKEDFPNEKAYSSACADAKEEVNKLRKMHDVEIPEYVAYCPSCGSELDWDDNGTELVCSNLSCKSMLISKIEHFFTTMLVEEFGRPSIETVYEAGYHTIYDILTKYKEFSTIPGMGEGTVAILDEQFTKLFNTEHPLARILQAFDLFEGKIGEKVVQNIFDNYVYSPGVNSYSISKLVEIKGVSDITAKVFISGKNKFVNDLMSNQGFNTWFNKTFKYYLKTPQQEPTGNKLSGANVCFSGIRDKDLEGIIISEGGKIASGVSKNTTHLIVADVNQSTSKTEAARKLLIPIHTIESFKELISK